MSGPEPEVIRCSWCARQHRPGPENCLTGVLLVCGSRIYSDWDRLCEVLDRTALRVEILAVRHGDCLGADALAQRWAEARGYPVQPFPANWELGRKAGPLRNAEMLTALPVPVACVAFPEDGGTGTADMIRRCEAIGLPVWRVKP